MKIFYRPPNSFVGDVIPFYWEGVYHAFYLPAPLERTRRASGLVRAPFAHLISADLVHWEEEPLAVEPGSPGEPDDMACFTGSFIERDGLFHLFYTGHRGYGVPETICRATSSDLRAWNKDPQNPILRADARWYETDFFWRDPFVFWNQEAGQYWMLFGARVNDGPVSRRACTGLAVSPDLEHWEVHPPFWAPYLYDHPHECPSLFRWGDRWVLFFSTHGFARYRVSESLNGPWYAPANDNLGPFFYPAKFTSDKTRHLVFGWHPTLADESDGGAREWGGHMAFREIRLVERDTIAVGPTHEIEGLFSEPHPLAFQSRLGEWETDGASFAAGRTDGLSVSTLGEMPNPCRISLTLFSSSDTRACGLLLRARPDLEGYYQLRWEPGLGQLTYRRWRRQFPYEDDSLAGLPLQIPEGGSMDLTIHIEDTIVVAYVNNTVALSCRAYDYSTGQLGLFVESGEARFVNVAMSGVPESRQ